MKFSYLSKEQINELKINLMSKRSLYYPSDLKVNKNNEKLSSSLSFSEIHIQNKYTERGPLFEENVRKTVYIELKWENKLIKRNFFYRTISIGRRTLLIKKAEGIKIKLNGRLFKFFVCGNGILSIYIGGIRRRFIGNISEKKKTKTYCLYDVKMKVSGLIEGEIDELLQIKNISFNDLLKN